MAQTYTDEDREFGLGVLAIEGNAKQASRALKAQGRPVPPATLEAWRKRYPERYDYYCGSRWDVIRKNLSPKLIQHVERKLGLEALALDKLEKKLAGEGLTIGNLSAALRVLGQSRNEDTKRLHDATNEALGKDERKDYHEIIKALVKSGAITVEAEEVSIEDPPALPA